jgi:hypothetical protein
VEARAVDLVDASPVRERNRGGAVVEEPGGGAVREEHGRHGGVRSVAAPAVEN